jgi:hypothetical protein
MNADRVKWFLQMSRKLYYSIDVINKRYAGLIANQGFPLSGKVYFWGMEKFPGKYRPGGERC